MINPYAWASNFNIFVIAGAAEKLLVGCISFMNNNAPSISAIATVAVAFFTLTLQRSTDKLWRAGETQLTIAKQATSVAMRQTQLMVNIELPVFVIEDAKTLSADANRGIEIKLGNHGRTPAIMVSQCLETCAAKSLPHVPKYTAENKIIQLRDRIVDRGQVYEVVGFNPISDELWHSFQNGQINFWVYGYFEYLDFMKEKHVEGFCIAFLPARKTKAEKLYDTLSSNSTTWVRTGNAGYTYNKIV